MGPWSNEEGPKEEPSETANIYFMEIKESSEVRTPNYPKCLDSQNTFDIITDELQKVIDVYNKLSKDKKNWKILLEASTIEVNLLQEELYDVKMQLNNIRKYQVIA